MGRRWTRCFDRVFGLTPAEEEQARQDAGKPRRTAYRFASHDWPVVERTQTVEEAYAAVQQVWPLKEEGDA